ncbi:unnamed protein product [Cuscuta campestris]|uniref:Uncharacterized protein n=1 Tax=Cuscuta campestris TaxID=132261 RepID=A0A484KE98_9ASTE|nr:unnamed protein product [Cuscuta campestris]
MDICAQHCKGSLCGEEKEGCFSALQFSLWTATSVAGRLVAHAGILQAIWPYSGHYLPTEDNFKEFITFLEEHKVDLTNVKRCSIDDDGGLSSVIGSAFTALKKEMTRCYET